MRFQKRIKLLPGLRLNLSKSGISASVGRPGATVNLSAKGVKGTVGLPGTGLSHTQQLSPRRGRRRASEAPPTESAHSEDPRGHEIALGVVIFVCLLVGIAWMLSKA